jgi:hypothetical protein
MPDDGKVSMLFLAKAIENEWVQARIFVSF